MKTVNMISPTTDTWRNTLQSDITEVCVICSNFCLLHSQMARSIRLLHTIKGVEGFRIAVLTFCHHLTGRGRGCCRPFYLSPSVAHSSLMVQAVFCFISFSNVPEPFQPSPSHDHHYRFHPRFLQDLMLRLAN